VCEHTENAEECLFLAGFDLVGGRVTALKICYPPYAPDIFAAGMHTTAMMPCRHLAFYEDGRPVDVGDARPVLHDRPRSAPGIRECGRNRPAGLR